MESDDCHTGVWTAAMLQQLGANNTAGPVLLPVWDAAGEQAPRSSNQQMQSLDDLACYHDRMTGTGEGTRENGHAAAPSARPHSPFFFLTSAQHSARPGSATAVEGQSDLRPHLPVGGVSPDAEVDTASAVATAASAAGADSRSSVLTPGGMLSQIMGKFGQLILTTITSISLLSMV